jgi:hypothetical protein
MSAVSECDRVSLAFSYLSEANAASVMPVQKSSRRPPLDGVFNTSHPMLSFEEAVLHVARKKIDQEVQKSMQDIADEIHAMFGRSKSNPIKWYDEHRAKPDVETCLSFAQQFLEGTLDDIEVKVVTTEYHPHPYKSVCKQLAQQYRLTKDEIAAIRLYTMNCDFFKWLNFYLRQDNRDLARLFFPFIRLLMTALAKLPKFEGPLLFRGMRNDCTANFRVSPKYTAWFFESFSTNYRKALKFAKPAGAPAGAPRTLQIFSCRQFSGATPITWFSRYPFEDEVRCDCCCFIVFSCL